MQLAALVGFSSEREFLLGVIWVQKKVRLKNKHGVERSEVCGAYFFSKKPMAFREVLSSAGPRVGLDPGVHPSSGHSVISHSNYTGFHDSEEQNPRG